MAGYGDLIVRQEDTRVQSQGIAPQYIVHKAIRDGIPLVIVGHFITEAQLRYRIAANPALRAITCTKFQPDVKLDAARNLPS